MLNSSVPRPNLRLVTNDDTAERQAAAELLRKLAADLVGNPAAGPWRERLMAATSLLLDGPEAELGLDELRYLRDVLRVPARDLPVLER